MKTSDNITVTDGRLKKAISSKVEPLILPKVQKEIVKAVNDVKGQIGNVTKVYPYLDKCEVQLDNKLVLCRKLHLFGGELIDFYTPNGDEEYCDRLKEPCIIPRGELPCLVLDTGEEYVMLGYLSSEELIGVNPATMGNLKIVTRGGLNQYWIKFGYDGLDIRSPSAVSTNIGETDEDMQEITPVNSDEVYSKSEIDEIINNLRNELLGENNNGADN